MAVRVGPRAYEVRRLPWLALRRLGLRHWRDRTRPVVRERDGRVVVEWASGRAGNWAREPHLPAACRVALGIGGAGARLRMVYDLARGELVLGRADERPPRGTVVVSVEPREPHRRADDPSYQAWRSVVGWKRGKSEKI